jgi:hypothetical protein
VLTDAEIAELQKLDAEAAPPDAATWQPIRMAGRLTLPTLLGTNAVLAGAARRALPLLLEEVVTARSRCRSGE